MMRTALQSNEQIKGKLPVAKPEMLVSSQKPMWHKSYNNQFNDTSIEAKGGNPS
jgi:hypothetical protein